MATYVKIIAGRYAGHDAVVWDDRQGAKTLTVHIINGPTDRLATVRRTSIRRAR